MQAESEICLFEDALGKMHQVNGAAKIPAEYKAKSRCFKAKKESYLAPPDAIQLGSNIRSVELSSSLGRVELRWPRKVDNLFGKTPERAVVDAMRTVSKTVKQSGFPIRIRSLYMPWKIVFLDEELPETQIPGNLVSNCHPAWMTPPSNIYVVAQRVVAGCSGRRAVSQSVADAELAEVLLHEVGHAIEAQLLGRMFGGDRIRAEGFATWFEQFAADYSQIIPSGKLRNEQLRRANVLLTEGRLGRGFVGNSDSYIEAALPFHAIVAKRRVVGLMELYEYISGERVLFRDAVRKKTGWSNKRLALEIRKVIQQGKN